MGVPRYADFQRAIGLKLTHQGDIWWQQVRPFFYRPLLPFKTYDLKSLDRSHKLGIFQHAVLNGQRANSYLNPVVFDDLANYELRNIGENGRRNLKRALNKKVRISPISKEREFAEKAYPVYLSFYDRTRYSFDTSRRDKSQFARWTRTIFQFPELLILGAFVDEELVGFEITCLVENVLIIDIVVHSDESLRCGAPDLLLHHQRSIVADCSDIHIIYDSMLAQNRGINEFKLRRGARVLALPALLHLHPFILQSLKMVKQNIYGRLYGLSYEKVIGLNHSRTFASDSHTQLAINRHYTH
jgi:hypothetical protein